MVIDESLRPDPSDPLRPPEDVAREVLGTAAKDHRTYMRHITDGVTIRGRVVKLRAIRTGRTFETTRRAFLAFLAELNPDAAAAKDKRSPVKRRRSSERAADALKRMGV